MLVTKHLLVPIDFSSMEKNNMEVNEDQKLFGCPHSSKYLFCVQQKKDNYY